MTKPWFKPVADHALLVEFATQISDAANRDVLALDQALAKADVPGVIEVVPAFVNLLIDFDPLVTDHTMLEATVGKLLKTATQTTHDPVRHAVQICYDADLAPDLAAVAKACELSPETVINAHLAGDYRVCMYGFAPGYAYMAGVPDPIQVPRKAAAVRDVSAGSVIIAGPQCLITTLTMPTGWSVIGRSPSRVLLNRPDRTFLFDVGDHVAFERIDRATYDRLSKGSPHD